MLEQELLIRTVQVMNDHNIEYMLTGSYVSSLQGQPRSTHDIDIVADILATHVHHLIKAFPHPQYYLDEASVKDAIKQKDMFNVIETDSGNKIDYYAGQNCREEASNNSRMPWVFLSSRVQYWIWNIFPNG